MEPTIYALNVAQKDQVLEKLRGGGCTVNLTASSLQKASEEWQIVYGGERATLYFSKVTPNDKHLVSVIPDRSVKWSRRREFLVSVDRILKDAGLGIASLAEIEIESNQSKSRK